VGTVALDASVAIGFLEPGDAHHERAVAALRELRGSRLIIAASAYSETLVRPLATGVGESVEAFFDRLQIEVVAIDRETARRAAELRAEHRSMRLPDALVVATAQLRGAELLSFDRRLRTLAQS
jgi:predicted nucleic acid-binding protein